MIKAEPGVNLVLFLFIFLSFYAICIDASSSDSPVATCIDAANIADVISEEMLQNKAFAFEPWGRYYFVEMLEKRFFAAYDEAESYFEGSTSAPYLFQRSGGKSLLKIGYISEVLIDDDRGVHLTSGTPLRLQEGYELVFGPQKDTYFGKQNAELNTILMELRKDGSIVESRRLQPSKELPYIGDGTYYYRKNMGESKNITTIAVHFTKDAVQNEADAVTADGIFQISENPIAVKTEVP